MSELLLNLVLNAMTTKDFFFLLTIHAHNYAKQSDEDISLYFNCNKFLP